MNTVFALIKIMVVVFLVLGIKNFLNSVLILLKLRMSDMISRNQIIEYDNFRGKIVEVKLRGITIENKNGDQMFIHLERWKHGRLVYPRIDGLAELEENKEKEHDKS